MGEGVLAAGKTTKEMRKRKEEHATEERARGAQMRVAEWKREEKKGLNHEGDDRNWLNQQKKDGGEGKDLKFPFFPRPESHKKKRMFHHRNCQKSAPHQGGGENRDQSRLRWKERGGGGKKAIEAFLFKTGK